MFFIIFSSLCLWVDILLWFVFQYTNYSSRVESFVEILILFLVIFNLESPFNYSFIHSYLAKFFILLALKHFNYSYLKVASNFNFWGTCRFSPLSVSLRLALQSFLSPSTVKLLNMLVSFLASCAAFCLASVFCSTQFRNW